MGETWHPHPTVDKWKLLCSWHQDENTPQMKLETQIKLNSYFAILFGSLVGIVETYRRFGDFGYWSRWMDDYIIALMLIVPAILVLSGKRKWIPAIIAGYGFSAGLLYGSFLSKFRDPDNIEQSNIESDLLIMLIGLGRMTSILGLI